MTPRPRVFVVNEPLRPSGSVAGRGIDLRPAYEYGELVHLLPAGSVPDDARKLRTDLERGLEAFDGEKDFLLPVGDLGACVMAAAILGAKTGGTFRFLRWVGAARRYAAVDAT